MLSPLANMSDEAIFKLMSFYNETKEFEDMIGFIIPTIFAFVIAVGLVGNLLVVIVALNRQMRNSTYTLIIGLACSDLMFLTLCVPFTAIDYSSPVWIFPHWMCNMINYLQHASAYFSVWTLTLMAVDRFLAVCYPVESMTLRSTRNTLILLTITYTVILISQIPVAKIHDIYEYQFIIESRSTCAIVDIAKGEATVAEARSYFFSFNVFGYILPLGITCLLYYCMLKRLWYTPRPGSCHQVAGSTRNRPDAVKAKRKVTRLVMCVVVIWAVCWLPLNICFFCSGLVYPDTLVIRGGKLAVIVQISSQVLAYTNSCLNPLLYALMSENFRKGFMRVITLTIYQCSFGCCCKSQLRSNRFEVTFYNQPSQANVPSRSASTHCKSSQPNEQSSLLAKSNSDIDPKRSPLKNLEKRPTSPQLP
uniref:G_PROTEIN_RECEP_F1_2 domain-containing protein n=1 Tax=Steinernema glaseri TaxID=37863 RepID=A0A1I7ZVJ8_9BILA